MGANEVCTLDPLIASFVNGKSSFDSFLSDVKRLTGKGNLDDVDPIVFKLVKGWTSEDNSSPWCVKEPVDVSQMLDIICAIKRERLFCQIILLIPEKRKRKFIMALRSTANVVEHAEIMQHLFMEACGHYSQNFMLKIDVVDGTVIDTFFKNIVDIFQWCETLMSKNMFSVFHFIDNILGDSAGEKYDHEPLSLLNKSGKKNVGKLLLEAEQSLTDDKSLSEELSFNQKLLSVEGYSLFLDNILAMLIPAVKEYSKTSLSPEIGVVIHRIVSKLNDLKSALSEEGCTCGNKPVLLLTVEEMLRLLCEKLASRDVEAVGGKNSLLVFYKWKVEADPEKKFVFALECLNSLYFGYQDIFAWMLEYKDLTEKQFQAFVNHMSGYAVNFGCPDTLTRYIEKIFLLQTRNTSSCLVAALQQVVHNCIPYASIRSCNTVLKHCIVFFTGSPLLLLSSSYTSENFNSTLNEVFNKLTSQSSCSDKQLFNKLSCLCLLSPLMFLQDFIHRIFANLLNHLVFRSVIIDIPALYHFDIMNDQDLGVSEKLPAVLAYTKNSWIKNSDKQTASKNLIAVLNVLLELLPEEIMDKFYHSVIDLFVYPNLKNDSTDNAFLTLDLTLHVVDILVQWPCCKVMSVKHNLTLIGCLMSRVVKQYSPVDGFYLYDRINSLVCDLVALFAKRLGEFPEQQLSSLDSAAELIEKYGWDIAFYFFNLFISFGYPFQFKIPQRLIDFCSSPDNFMAVSKLENDATNDECAWVYLFELAYISVDAALALAERIQSFDIDDDSMAGLVESAALVLKNCPCVGTAKSVIAVLSHLVSRAQTGGVTEYFRDELCDQTQHHGMCLSMLVLVQSFIMLYDDLEEDRNTRIQEECQNHMRVFHLFLQYAKAIEDPHIRSFILLYLFEQLVFSASVLGDLVRSVLMMLLMDILVAIMDSTNSATKDVKDQVMEQCISTVKNADGDFSMLLERLVS